MSSRSLYLLCLKQHLKHLLLCLVCQIAEGTFRYTAEATPPWGRAVLANKVRRTAYGSKMNWSVEGSLEIILVLEATFGCNFCVQVASNRGCTSGTDGPSGFSSEQLAGKVEYSAWKQMEKLNSGCIYPKGQLWLSEHWWRMSQVTIPVPH